MKDQSTAKLGTEPAKQPDVEAKPEPNKDPTKPVATDAPDKYDFKAPEGRELDAKAIEAITPIFKELGLTQDQASKLVDFQMAREAAANDGLMKQMEATRTEWRDKVIKDSALGNGIDNLKLEVRANIDKAIKSIGDEKAISIFKEAMDFTGVGDHPAFISAFNALGKLLSEGTAVRGAGPASTGQTAPGAGAKPTPAQALYPKLPSSAAS